jgi:hypothetical protein
MSYGKLGTSCCEQTRACTSNRKFLPLCAPLYRQKYNYMTRYPVGRVNTFTEPPKEIDHVHPKPIKTYYGKLYTHDDAHDDNHDDAHDGHTYGGHPYGHAHGEKHDHGHDHAPGHGHGPTSFRNSYGKPGCKGC